MAYTRSIREGAAAAAGPAGLVPRVDVGEGVIEAVVALMLGTRWEVFFLFF
jgi:hypothetical protein